MFKLAMQKLYGRSLPRLCSTSASILPDGQLKRLQEEAMAETCYLVDERDKILGTASKSECHIVKPDGSIPLHRGFSVYIFNSKNELMLQKRSRHKITYPDRYSNTCCSHPIAEYPGEEEEKDALGVKRAAQRRLHFELGISPNLVPLEKLDFISRIRYYCSGNGKWGEHEVAYMLFLRADLTPTPNSSEVSEVRYVTREEFDAFLGDPKLPTTPWFYMLSRHYLKLWWDNLDNLEKVRDHDTVIDLGRNPRSVLV